MGFIRRYFSQVAQSTHARKACRELLKSAKNENHEQFLALAAGHVDLAQTYFGSSLHESDSLRARRTSQIFQGLWQNLRYAKRLSDFEYMLAQALIESTPLDGPISSQNQLITKMRLLSPRTRFAFIAHELENWPLRYVGLVMRVKIPELHRLLSEARCELCGISWESLAKEERACLEAISASLEKCPNPSANRALCKRLNGFPRVSEIRSEWVSLRPELVEVRLRFIGDARNREEILENILRGICETSMQEKPPLVDRLVNTVQFSRHAKINVS
ncbi:MAG: hypothetical protein AAF546_05310 [Verrucomicrobiota bacterium]